MDHAIGREARAGFGDSDMSGKSSRELFGNRLADARLNARAERIADVHVLS
jgi:hypothetical protein